MNIFQSSPISALWGFLSEYFTPAIDWVRSAVNFLSTLTDSSLWFNPFIGVLLAVLIFQIIRDVA